PTSPERQRGVLPPPRWRSGLVRATPVARFRLSEETMAGLTTATQAAIERVAVSAYTVPTDQPEADGTIAWDKTTLVLVEASAGGQTGLGYTYADTATARLIHDSLADVLRGHDALDIPAAWVKMWVAVRNLGRPGVSAMAISAV